MRLPQVLIAIAAVVVTGCAHSPEQGVPASPSTTPAPASPAWMNDRAAVDRVAPIIGRWTIDLDATLAADGSIPGDQLGLLADDLREHPFSLEITGDRYISRSRERTIADRYEPLGYDDDGYLWLALRSATNDPTMAPRSSTTNPADLASRQGRKAVLRFQGDRLFIKGAGGPDTTIVMRRVGR